MPTNVHPTIGSSGVGSDEVERTQWRLRDLLRATTTIVERLDIEVVLRRVVEAAMALVDASFGAFGVITPDGSGRERFIHLGMDAATVAHLAQLPAGQGLMGTVNPVRLQHLDDQTGTAGMYGSRPAMESFLGVSVTVGGREYGHLYLAHGVLKSFSADDEDLIVALAATAGIAIENARLYDVARAREEWSATTADVMAAMLEATREDVLGLIVERMSALIFVDLVALAVPYGVDELRVTTAHGSGADRWTGQILPAGGTFAADALASRRAARVSGEKSPVAGEPALGPTVAIPLFAGDEPLGVLIVARRPDSPPFTDADVDMAFTFAAQAGVAIEVVRAREDRSRVEQSRDRARIARDLHDHVIQRLFGAGLSLQAIAATAGAGVSTAIETQVDVIDAAIKDIRTVIFALGSSDRKQSRRPRDRILGVLTEMATQMPAIPRLTFSGPLDSLVSDELTDELTAVLRECLTNVIKHADAAHVEVDLSISDGTVTLTVEDDGRGIPVLARLSGVANISERAQLLGGTCTITPRLGGGTRVEWTVPAPDDRRTALGNVA